MRIFHHGAGAGKTKWSQIQFVKSVKQIGTEFEVGTLLPAWDRESRVLGDTQVHRPVTRPTERVASDSRRTGSRDIKERLAATGEVAVLTQENVVCCTGEGASRVGHGTDWAHRRPTGEHKRLPV